MNINYKRLLLVFGAVALVLTAFFIFRSMQFRITGTTPDSKNYPASLGIMDVSFSKKLNQSALEKRLKDNPGNVVSVNFEGGATATVNDNKLRLRFKQTPLPGKYKVNLRGIEAETGQKLDAELSLNIKDIPYEDMSEEVKALYDEFVAEGNADNISEYPLLDRLPHETAKYLIGYRYDHETDPVPTLEITMKFFEPGDMALPATPAEQEAYLNDIRKYRTEALNWIKSQGASLDDYILVYTEPTLQEEFPTGHGKFFEGTTQDGH